MDTSDGRREESTGTEQFANRHYSTGLLTERQQRIVVEWRNTLTQPDMRRWKTSDHRPPASSSDCIAAAVVSLLDSAQAPTPIELAAYASRTRIQQHAARGAGFPMSRHVSFYLPGLYADRLEQLLTDAQTEHARLLDDRATRAEDFLDPEEGAAAEQRAVAAVELLRDYRLPLKAYRLPAGTVARMAIERWDRRRARSVIAEAVAYGEKFHQQQHRLRADTGIY